MSKHRYLSRDLVRTLLIFIILIFFMSQAVLLYMNYRDMQVELENRIGTYIIGLNRPISEAVWDYDNDQIAAMGDSFFFFEEITLVEIIDNVTGLVYQHQRPIAGKNKEILYNINNENETLAVLKLSYTDYYMLQALRSDFINAFLIFVIITIVIIYYIRLFTKKVVRPLRDLSLAAEQMSSNLSMPIQVDTESLEMAILVENFEKMRVEILSNTKTLEVLNDALEDKVMERTEALEVKNQELSQTIELLQEAELELMRASKMELTQQLVSGVAHELNTPLGNAITLLSFLQHNLKDLDPSSDVHKSISLIQANLEESRDLIEQFKALDFRSSISDEKEARLVDIVTNTSILMPLGHCDFVRHVDIPKDMIIKTKPFILMEVIKELLENACCHAYDAGEEVLVDINAVRTGDKIKLNIKDYGKGMAPSTLENIFKPFEKNRASSAGTGLGLSIVENLVVYGLDGKILCESQLDQGTTFSILLKG